jgi:SHS2 domain-containing protein
MKYEILDISGDIGIRAYGRTPSDVLVNAAIGMYGLITDLNRVEEKNAITVSIEADSLEGLIVRYLNELIFYFDTYGFIGKRIDINSINEEVGNFNVITTVYGEDFDPERHERRLLIKAATYHNIKVEKINDELRIDVIFDI